MAPLTFTRADDRDIHPLVALVESAYRGEASTEGWTSEAHLIGGQRVDPEMLMETLERDDAIVVLAHDAEGLVACCELEEPASDGVAHLGMFAVRPGLQGGGIGRQVLDEAERIARDEWDAGSLQLEVIDARDSLIAWYERRGYLRTGVHKPFPYGDERFGVPRRDDLRFEVLAKRLG